MSLPGLSQWSAALGRLANRPLELCPDFPAIARRHEAWWSGQVIDRPVLMVTANREPARPISRRLDLLSQPGRWLAKKMRDARQYHCCADALPHVRVDFGPVMLGGLLGGRTEFVADTTWTHPCIDDQWSSEPAWRIDPQHPWWKLLGELLELTARAVAGRCLLCTPDVGGSADVLLNLRGSEGLCMDLIERPDRITRAVDALFDPWCRTFARLYDLSLAHGAGLIHWLGLWSIRPYVIPACDFSFMIGSDDFQRLFLPDIARQAVAVGRAVFHLDGPGATRHIDALLEIEHLNAVQFTPGSSSPSALAWVEMFRRIQVRGRSVLIVAPPDEVLELCRLLRPEGLAIITHLATPAQADALTDAVNRRFGVATVREQAST